ncbi:FISUMP domain-containing protein [Dysgonomonas sp. 25]|uniref:FISUMP domain-containing protein n=1 Tax=Dysgonomonas sp. 25 TaxID=2302933 RepID=UPI0013D576C9|nr:FISUMP domain-containing protein [Dysgonomonas sp. 25]NDV69480.1 hypothetical protein [Dysgonomonas sp. 25]
MKQKTLTQAITIIALTLTTTALHGQVTIGSGEKPRAGALLDLTEGATTTHGLNLPRVELTKLKPTTPADLSASIGGTGNWVLADHTALVVYNTKESNHCASERIYKGLYVFDGTEWQYLGLAKLSTSADVHSMVDSRDGNTYLYREFYYMNGAVKVSAGEWMLENLRYIPNNTDAGFTGFTHTAADGSSPYIAKYWSYPWKGISNSTETYNATQAQADWESRTGILYNWSAAVNGRTTTSNPQEGQGDANEADAVGIRGICPAGWHLPTDREWNELERAIYNNKEAYSQYTSTDISTPTTWQDNNTLNWETGTVPPANDARGSYAKGHGFAMLSECELPRYVIIATNGKSLPASQGGFNVFLAGFSLNSLSCSYGHSAHYWSSSSRYSNSAWSRSISNIDARVTRKVYGRNSQYSVRCKKD